MNDAGRPSGPTEYVFGHAEQEIGRLVDQSTLYSPYTEQALRAAGLRDGMRVLDVGCGAGDVSFLAADLVGPSGSVIGVDASADAVAGAAERARARGVTTVDFRRADLPDVELDAPVDVLVGRWVLVHLPDPVATLRELTRLVRPGGVVMFQEFVVTDARTVPPLPLFTDTLRTAVDTLTAVGIDPDLGLSLPDVFVRAGLSPRRSLYGAPLATGSDRSVFEHLVGGITAVAPRANGVDAARLDLPTLVDRLADEATAASALSFGLAVVAVLAVRPETPDFLPDHR